MAAINVNQPREKANTTAIICGGIGGLPPQAGVPIQRLNKAPLGRESGSNGAKSNFEMSI
jgi:hypothetical protein